MTQMTLLAATLLAAPALLPGVADARLVTWLDVGSANFVQRGHVYSPTLEMEPRAVEAVAIPGQVEDGAYIVVFDWDRAGLTGRARQVIAESARASQRAQITRIEVAGHTDNRGTARHNAMLSVHRATSIAAELVRLGVTRAGINVRSYGESRPLVLAPGVRKPQNHRVEIVFR